MLKTASTAAVCALLFLCSPAVAQAPFTKESCIAFLTTNPAGPLLDERKLRIGSTVAFDGKEYRIFEGMNLDSAVCSPAVERRNELAARDVQIAHLTQQVVDLDAAGKQNVRIIEAYQKNWFINHWLDMAVLASALAGLLLFLFVWGFFGSFLSRMYTNLTRKRRISLRLSLWQRIKRKVVPPLRI
ncbi:MAG TPA: hypothetical protein VGE23_01685 [Candidatus Paceibacterota bacterium]